MSLVVPDELDVFSVPHSRMKELVNSYYSRIENMEYMSSSHSLRSLLDSLSATFIEFKCHERIENKLIMQRLNDKMKQKSDFNSLVCDCHKDNRVSEMLNLFADGFKASTAEDRINYGRKLSRELHEFTNSFLPHMKEEEEVFQPLLIQYFSYEELRALKQSVIHQHSLESKLLTKDSVNAVNLQLALPTVRCTNNLQSLDNDQSDSLQTSSHSDSVDGDDALLRDRTSIDSLPVEVLLEVFQYLSPQDLCRCAQVCRYWTTLSFDPSLWTSCLPTQWANGHWSFHEIDVEGECQMDSVGLVDDDDDVQLKVTMICLDLMSFVLPTIGYAVTKLVLSFSTAVTDEIVSAMLLLCPNVKFLDLSMTNITDAAFQSCFNGLRGKAGKEKKQKYIEHINLSGCHLITDHSIELLTSDVSRLRYANLSSCLRLTSAGLWQLARAAPSLDPTQLYYCDNIRDGPYPNDANGCSNLEYGARRKCCRTGH